MRTVEELERIMTEPSTELIDDVARLDGDIMLLGVGGKMGPTMAKMARRAVEAAGVQKRVIGVSRFSDAALVRELNDAGIETIAADLLDEDELAALPEVANIIYLAGRKFGTTGQEHLSWAMNTYLPGRVAAKFRSSRIVAFSTGNVYPLTPVAWGGATESSPVGPVGEYAQSCLGRERIFEYFSHLHGTPVLIFRLNYAIDMRYGVLNEVAQAVWEGRPIDLTMGHVNVIWQGDANEIALRSLHHCSTPPTILNVTGPETVSIRKLALRFGELFGKEPVFRGEESATALLSDAAKMNRIFGYPKVTLDQMIEWTADWVAAGGVTYDKPTHFQEREGRF